MAIFANKGGKQAFGVGDEIEAESALYAQEALVDSQVGMGCNLDNAVFADVHENGAAAATIRTDGGNGFEFPFASGTLGASVRHGPCGTDINAVATLGAGGLVTGLVGRQGDTSVEASAEIIDGCGGVKVLADLDTSATKDALGAVVDDGWSVAEDFGGSVVGVVGGFFYAELVSVFLEVASAGPLASQTVVRMVREQKLNEHTTGLAELFGVAANDHAISGKVRTRGHEISSALDFDEAETTGTGGGEIPGRIITKVRDVYAGELSGLEDGRAIGHADLDVVNR